MFFNLRTLVYFLVVLYIRLTYFNKNKEDIRHMFATL